MMTIVLILGAVAVSLLAWFASSMQSAYYSSRGVKIEQRSIAALQLPVNWKVEPNKPVPGHGDADIFITAPDGGKWNIEIKSYEGAKKAPFSFFRKEEIVRPNGKPFQRDPIVQVRGVSEKLNSQPVLWMPKARRRPTFKTRSGVVVVQGGSKQLERAIGARAGWFW